MACVPCTVTGGRAWGPWVAILVEFVFFAGFRGWFFEVEGWWGAAIIERVCPVVGLTDLEVEFLLSSV